MGKIDYLSKYTSSSSSSTKKKKKRRRKNSKIRIRDDDEDFFENVKSREFEVDVEKPLVVSVEDGSKGLDNGSGGGRKGKWMDVNGGRRRHDSDDDDESPPRRRRRRHDSDDDDDDSPPRRRRRHDSDDDTPPRRRRRHDSDDDSPPRRRRRHDSDDDSPPRRRRRHDSDDDDSPPRRRRHDSDDDDDDSSPPRNRRRHDSDDDDTPPRRQRRQDSDDDDDDDKSKDTNESNENDDKRRGYGRLTKEEFQQSLQRKREAEAKRLERLEKSGASGRGQATVYRDKSGKRVEKMSEFLREEMARTGELAPEEQRKEEFDWRVGRVQKEEMLRKAEAIAKAKDMDLNQYEGDPELERRLKERERAEDPMLAYMRKKKSKKKKKKKKKKSSSDRDEKPLYRGPLGPPNRYGIRPGYRWDGVDRGNGFDSRLAATRAKKRR